MITRDFKLQDGVDIKGVIVTEGVMRLVLNKDIIALNHDVRLRELSKMQTGIGKSSEENPLGSMLANSAITEMFCVLFARIIIKFGDLDSQSINYAVLSELTQRDMNSLIAVYADMNGEDLEEIKRKVGGSEVPFAQSES